MDALVGGSPGRVAELEAENRALREELERLRESEKMYRFSAEIGGRLVWSTDPEGKVLSISRLFSRLTGVAEDQVLMERWIEGVHEDERQAILDQWAHSLATGDPFRVEFRGLLPDGSVRTLLSRAMPARDREGRIVRWYGSTEDVHEERRSEQARREAEERLRESEELYRYTIELSEQLVWTATPRGRLLSITPRFAELTGRSAEEDPTAAWEATLHPDDRQHVFREWRKALEVGKPYRSEFRMRLANGEYRIFEVRAAPRRDEEGRIVRWYGTTLDVDDQKLVERARAEAEERYRLAARATNDAVWDYDVIAGTVDWSAAAAEIFGVAKPPGRTSIGWWEERLHPEDKLRVAESLSRAIESGAARWSETYRIRREDGSDAEVLDRGFIIRAEDGTGVRAVGAIADLTDRRRAEAEIRRMQAELVHVSRVSAMGTMASTLAHELNQPLTAVTNFVRGASRIVARQDQTDPLLPEALQSAEAGALRAGEIVRRLRELVSRGTVAIAVEHLPKLIEEASVLAFVDRKLLGIEHKVALDPAAQWIRADRVQIQQVLINLVRNAVEAMAESPVREIEISSRAIAGDLVEIRVADTGPGIAPEHMDSLFSQFMTTKTEGMGIGLPISRTIVEAHGGKIWAENRESGGAVFCFTLPRARRRSPEAAAR